MLAFAVWSCCPVISRGVLPGTRPVFNNDGRLGLGREIIECDTLTDSNGDGMFRAVPWRHGQVLRSPVYQPEIAPLVLLGHWGHQKDWFQRS